MSICVAILSEWSRVYLIRPTRQSHHLHFHRANFCAQYFQLPVVYDANSLFSCRAISLCSTVCIFHLAFIDLHPFFALMALAFMIVPSSHIPARSLVRFQYFFLRTMYDVLKALLLGFHPFEKYSSFFFLVLVGFLH